MTKTKKPKMTLREQLKVILKVGSLSYKTAPVAVIFKFIGTIFGAVLPFVTTYFAALTTSELANAYAGDESAGSRVIIYVLITAGLGFLMTIWGSIDRYIQTKMRYDVESKVTDMMYEQLLSLDFWRYDDKETIDTYERAKRFADFFAYVFDRFAYMLGSFIMMAAGVGALLLVNVWLALFVLVAIIPGVIVQIRLSRFQMNHWNTNVDTRRARYMIEGSMFRPEKIAELRLYGVVKHLLKLRQKLRDKDEKERIIFERKITGLRILSDGVVVVAEVGSLIWITLQIIAREQPVGQFLFVQQVVSRALEGSKSFVTELNNIDEDIANLFDYETFMSLGSSVRGNKILQDHPSEIKFNHVSFRYPKHDVAVLDDVTLTIKRNQHVAIVGENGAGKSTLIKLLVGMYQPTKGQVLVDGKLLSEVDADSWHAKISVLQQNFLHYDFATARQNVLFGDITKNDEKLFWRSLEMAEASEFTAKLPKGVDSYVDSWMESDDGVNGVELSGGQWQRLALARNFYRDAPIIILDEPTSAIDALAEGRIFEHLFDQKDKTTITISHRLSTVEKADMIYVMENGQIAEQGTHDELVKSNGAYVRLFKAQLRRN